MNIQFRHRCLSMMLVLVMLFTMSPVTVIAEEEHDHSHDEAVTVLEVADLSVSASASANHVYVGDGAVTVTAKITGGMAPYEVTLQAVKNGDVAATDTVTTSEASAKLSFAPQSYGDYELVVVVHDALHTQELVSCTLAVAEHDEESEQEWAASVSGASLSSNWGRSLLSVAKTQVGYTESEKDFILKNGAKQGYSRYGAWYGTPYGGWNNAFLAFVAEYAGIPNDAFLSGSSYRSWVNGMSAKGAYEASGNDYAPKAGDVAFLSGSRVAIVESVSGSNVTVIEGDVDGAVARKTYALSKVAGFGNTGLLMGLSTGSATPVPTEAPEVTQAPEGSATATPVPTAKPTATVVPEDEELTFQATPTPRPGVTVAPKDDENPLGSMIAQVGETVEQLQAAATSVPTQFSEAYYLMKDEMTALVEKYLGTATPTEADIKAFVDGLGLQELYYLLVEASDLAEYADNIGASGYELEALMESENAFNNLLDMSNVAWADLMDLRVSGSFTLLDGLVTVSWDSTDTESTTFVLKSDEKNATFGVRGASRLNGGAQTLNVTFTNNATYQATLSFVMAANNLASYSGTAFPSSSGTITLTLDSGASVSGSLKSNTGWLSVDDTTGTFTNFALTEIIPAPKVTIDYDALQGTVSVDGTTVAAGTVKEVATGESIELTANVTSGTFQAWVDGDGKILSTSATFTLSPTANMTVKPFILKADTNPYFMVANQYLFDNLISANTKAATLGSSAATAVIVPLRDGTLPAADYTISQYVTLLIPYDSANTLNTTTPAYANAYSTPTAYRTLTMADGANITVNGAISVGGQQSAAGGTNGQPYGATGFIRMQSGSKITLNSGAALYAWGYIVGDGSIDALSGSKVYEDFQLEDWRGGSATTGMLENTQRVFPMSQYYVQNIEVPLKLYAGASEYGFMSVYAAYQLTGSEVPFIGSNGLFRNSTGYVIKDYVESADRLRLEISGSASIASLSITMSLVGTITSQDYVLPLNSGITIDVLGGSNISLAQDLALLPGSQFYVREGATINLSSGNNIFVYDLDDMKSAYVYRNDGAHFAALTYVPGRTSAAKNAGRSADAFIQIDGTISAADSYAYTTTGKANVYSTGTGKVTVLIGSNTATYQATQDDTDISYEEVAITPAYLKNADGSYVNIAATVLSKAEGEFYDSTPVSGDVVSYEYNSTRGVWERACDDYGHYYTLITVDATCTEQGYSQYVCQCTEASEAPVYTPTISHTYNESNATDYCLDRTCTVCGTLTEATIAHNTGKDYTCVDAVCTICGTTVTGDGNHVYTAKVETIAPTCTTDGYTRSTCACGEYQDDNFIEAAHTYEVTATVNAEKDDEDNWVWAWIDEESDVDCNAAGSVTYTCNVCAEGTEGKTYTVTIEAPGHNWDSGVVTEPKCYADGYTTYTCNRCNVTEDRDINTNRPDHTYGEATVVEATCITGGYTYKVCQVEQCQYKYTYDETDATGVHAYKVTLDDNVEEDGNGGYKTTTCTVNGEVIYTCTTTGCGDTYTETVKAPGHTEVTLDAVAATCTSTGLTEGKKCSVCDTVTEEQEEIGMLDHEYQYDVTAPTCTEQGVTVTTCKNCTTVNTITYKDPTGHNYVEDPTHAQYQAATCTEDGVKILVCSNANCPESVKTEVITKTGHSWVDSNVVAPTCMDAGYTEQTCANGCGETRKINEIEASLDYHKYVTVPGYPATCTTTGLTDGKQCTICEEWETEQTDIPALQHKWQNAEHEENTASTCVEQGDQYQICDNDDTHTQWVKLALLDHSAEHETISAKAPTCTEDGNNEYIHCSVCGIDINKVVIEKDLDNHDMVYVNAQAKTCTEAGWEAYEYCSRCGDAEAAKAAALIAAGHTIVSGAAQEKTCTQDGWEAYEYCSACDYTTKVTIPAGHVIEQGTAQEKTCTQDGWAAYEYCTECDYTTKVVISAGHVIKQGTAQEKTCTQDGWAAYEYCTECDYTTKVIISAGHVIEQGAAQEKTCTQDGWAAYEYCTECDYTTKVVIPAGHDIVEVEAKAKTCTTVGWEAYEYCTACTYTTYKEIPASHELADGEAKAVTCTEVGWDAYQYCTVEGCNYSTKVEIQPKHQQVSKITETIQPTCQAVGHYVNAEYCQACSTWLDEGYQIAKVDHSYTGDVLEQKDPTCYAEGYTITQCLWCDAYATTETTEKIAHSYEAVGENMKLVNGEWVRENCLTAGKVTYTCTNEGCTADAEGHSYSEPYEALTEHSGEWETTVAATCQTEGSKKRTCTACGAEENAVIAVLEHEEGAYTEYEELKATCLEAGHSAYKHCNICNLDIGKTVKPIDGVDGHDYQPVTGTPATCTETGLGDGSQCTICKEWQLEQEVIPATNHANKAAGEAKDATCTEDGHTAGMYCPDCDTWLEEQQTIPATNHANKAAGDAKAATCTEDGNTAGVYCPDCATWLEAQEVIPALDHEWAREGAEFEWVETKAATCYENGVLTWTCECGESTTDVIPMIDHTYNAGVPGKETTKWNETTQQWENCVETDTIVYTCQNAGCTAENSDTHTYTVEIEVTDHAWVYEAQDEPTCTEPGTASGKHCTRCGLEEGGGEIPAKGHTWDTGVGTGAEWDEEAQEWVTTSCTENGSVLYTCTLCHVGEYTKTVTITAPGHAWDDGTVAVEATCVEMGSTTYKCETCGEEKTIVDIPATGIHDQTVEIPGKDATCTETGLTTGWNCSMCGAVQENQTVIPAIHDTIEDITEAVDSTCTTPGHDVGSKKCDTCGEWFEDNVIPVKDHAYTVVVESVAATCEADAYEVKRCTWYAECGKEETFTDEGSKLGHDWKVSTTDGVEADGDSWKLLNCEVDGSVTYVCGNDESHTKTVTIEATGHQHTEVIPGQEVTCLVDGYKDGLKCTDCGTVITERELIPAKGEHTWGEWVTTIEPKCGVAGEQRRDCDECDEYQTNELAALEHNYDWDGGRVVTEVTCTTDGYTTLVCELCGTETVDPDSIVKTEGHQGKVVTVVAATCGSVGYTAGVQCSVCEEWITPRTEIPKLDHVYDDGVVTTEPDCENDGVKTFTCTQPGCNADIEGHTKTESVTKLGHTSEDVPAVDVTCTTDGCTAGKKCSVCGDILEGCEVIEHKGHQEETIPAVEVSCTEDGYTAGVKCSVCGTVLEEPVLTETKHHLDLIQVEAQASACEQIGWDAYEYCTKCDYTTYNELPALEHNKVTVEGSDATCDTDGLTDGVQCTLCQKWFTEQVTIPAAHKSVDVEAVEVTCTTDGYTAGKKCSVCGEILEGCEVIEHKGHQEETLEAKDPTCTETGLTEGKKCTVCGEITVKQDTVAKLGHDPKNLEEVAPTCTETGLTAGVGCSRCDYIYTAQTVLPAAGHKYETVSGKAATCTEDGLTDGEQCSVCDDWKVEQTVIPAAGHTEVTVTGAAATCTAAGKTDGVQCSVCKTWITAQTVIPAKGHTEEVLPKEDATCTAPGKEAGKKCTVCGIITVIQVEIPATGHTEEEIPAVAPTCTEAGNTAGVKCSVCQTVLTAPTALAATGHTEVTVKGTAATCTEAGLTDGVQCTVCDTWTVEQTVIDALGHTEVIRKAVAATCTETGLTEGKYCSVCQEELVEQEIVPANGHTEVVDAAVAATCTKTGLTEGKHCSVCNEILLAQETVDATGHTSVADPAVDPTCTETGKTAGSHCGVCGTVLEEQKTVNAKGHTEVIDKAQAATCTETGLTEGKHCSVCGEVLLAQEVTPATNHAGQAPGEAKAATCTEDGNTAGVYCPDCDTWLEEQETIPATNHAGQTPGEAKAETCTEAGNTAGVYCPDCDTWLEAQEVIPAKGHDMDEGVVTTPHSCTEAGEMTYTCNNGCGYTETEEIPAAHTPVVIEAVAPTCTTDGTSEGSKCSVCNEVLVEPTVVPAAHTWEDVEIFVEATCTEDGSKSVRCTAENCGATETVVIPATGHTEVIDPAKAATCEEDGLTAGKHCSVCNEVLIAQKVIEGGHRWSFAPCTAAGATCSRCQLVNEEMLEHNMTEATCTTASYCKYGCGKTEGEALGHTIVEIEEIPALCEEPGWTVGKMCSTCGVVLEAPKVIPALEHQIVQYEAKKPTFTSVGWEAYEACDFCAYSTKVEIPALGAQTISSYSEFMKYLPWLEKWAVEFAKTHPETDPVDLVIKYIRTGVDRYNSGSWGIMAGYENAEFAKYVGEQEDLVNLEYDNIEDMIKVSGLKNLDNFTLPNGDLTDIGHMFGTMDITYNNNCGVNHADVGGWAGDLVDLLSTADHTDHAELIASANGEFEALVDVIRYDLLGHSFNHSDVFSQTDLYGDLDAFYVMQNLDFENYAEGDMTALFNSYFTLSLNDVDRAGYLLEHRLNGVATRSAVRDAVYTAYTSNNVISTLEGTRDFNASDLTVLRQAVCYAFADYLCELAGDYVDVTENPYLTVFQSEHQQLAPGISMEIHMANSADDKQMVYYLAYASVGREDVDILANYNERYVTHWEMSRVLDQANSTQELYGDPESEYYIENFNVVTAINGAGFNMQTGEPGGLLVMHGEQYHAIDGNGFFGMHEDGYAVIGTTEEYNTKYKGKIVEAIAGFGTMLVKDGELAITATSDYYSNRASRTAVGITKTGKVVFMVLDGRQEPWSCGGSMIEIAQIMKNAGCVQAINLDGGGSTTFVARQEGDEDLSVVNRPSDGVARSVSTGLVMISTAPSSTAFDHAVVESDYAFLTVDSTVQMTAKGVSATGNVVDLPEGAYWAVSDETVGTIDENGVFTAKTLGSVEIRLMLDDAVLGYKTLTVVVPDMLYFTRDKIDGVYGASIELPLKARYEGKEVAFNANDIAFTLSNDTVGTMEGLSFNAVEESEITNVTITAALASDSSVNASISVVLFEQGENSFDFDQATGGSRILAWQREVSNANTADNSVYYVINPEEDMVTSYTIALDMTQIPIPERLNDLIYMLPGADMEGASAWTFLLQLAERISVLTTVKPQIQVDPNFDVDYSELKLINDYFELNGTEFDEETNTLTLTLNWIDQTQPIPVETANPLCMVTGLKLIPKDDAAWNDKDQLKPVNKGTVSYTIYMRASGLYSFAQKTENQETFGLYPFVNPNDSSEKGGYFQDTYAEFEDSYTLVRSLKNGWYNEDSGFRYYVNGVYYTGVQQADGLFYDFGEDGINVGKKTYTGLHVMDGNTYYIQAGEIGKGWNIIGDDWYYFDTTTGIGLNGDHMVSGHVYPFENGKVLHGVWVNDGVGLKYYYGPGNYYAGWRVIEGEEYFFEKNYAKTGITPVQESHDTYEYWYEFTETGEKVGFAPDGLHWYEGELYYIENGLADHEGLYYVDGNYYNFVVYSHYAVRAANEGEFKTFWVYKPNDTGKPEGMYRFDHLGRVILTNEIVEENGVLYYYEDGTRANDKGLVLFEGNYYYIIGGGRAVQDTGAWVTNVNGLDVKTGYYRFDENGHMIMDTAVVLESDGKYHYYEDGRRVYTEGLVEVDGDYYYIQSDGTALTDSEKYVSKTNGLKPKGTYYFGYDGKLIERLPGDADGDKDVDLDDVVMVYEYCAGEEVNIYLFNADVNDDDQVDATDALLIMQYDAGWDVTLK